MSRHSQTIINESGQPLQLCWGYDHALGYWYDISNMTIEENDGLIEEWSSTVGFLPKKQGRDAKSRSVMLEFLIKYNLSEEHKSLVGMDMPL